MSPLVSRRRAAAAVGAAVIAVGAGACGGGDDNGKTTAKSGASAGANAPPANRSQRLTGGQTVLTLDASARRLLDRAGVRLEAIGRARRAGGRFVFPIAGGQMRFTPLTGRIEHRGGIRLSAGGAHVDATDLVIRPGRGVMTAIVKGRRVPLLSLDPGRPRTVPVSHDIQVPATVQLTGSGLPGANDALVRSLLHGGVRVGTLRVAAET